MKRDVDVAPILFTAADRGLERAAGLELPSLRVQDGDRQLRVGLYHPRVGPELLDILLRLIESTLAYTEQSHRLHVIQPREILPCQTRKERSGAREPCLGGGEVVRPPD